MKSILKKFLRSQAGQRILSFLGYVYIQLIYRTSHWDYINKDIIADYLKAGKPFIICFWHGRLMMLPLAWQWPHPFSMLLSAHGDGALIAKVLAYFEINSVEGSTTRGGAKAVRHLLKFSKEGGIIGMTPDGPRGPVHTVSKGTVALAKWLQADLIPVSYATRQRRLLKTWDNFHWPLPFTRGAFIIGQPVPYPLNDQGLEQASYQLKETLDAITQQVDTLL